MSNQAARPYPILRTLLNYTWSQTLSAWRNYSQQALTTGEMSPKHLANSLAKGICWMQLHAGSPQNASPLCLQNASVHLANSRHSAKQGTWSLRLQYRSLVRQARQANSLYAGGKLGQGLNSFRNKCFAWRCWCETIHASYAQQPLPLDHRQALPLQRNWLCQEILLHHSPGHIQQSYPQPSLRFLVWSACLSSPPRPLRCDQALPIWQQLTNQFNPKVWPHWPRSSGTGIQTTKTTTVTAIAQRCKANFAPNYLRLAHLQRFANLITNTTARQNHKLLGSTEHIVSNSHRILDNTSFGTRARQVSTECGATAPQKPVVAELRLPAEPEQPMLLQLQNHWWNHCK